MESHMQCKPSELSIPNCCYYKDHTKAHTACLLSDAIVVNSLTTISQDKKGHPMIVHINPLDSSRVFQLLVQILKEIQKKLKEPSVNTYLPFGNCPTAVEANTSNRMLKTDKQMLQSKIILIKCQEAKLEG